MGKEILYTGKSNESMAETCAISMLKSPDQYKYETGSSSFAKQKLPVLPGSPVTTDCSRAINDKCR